MKKQYGRIIIENVSMFLNVVEKVPLGVAWSYTELMIIITCACNWSGFEFKYLIILRSNNYFDLTIQTFSRAPLKDYKSFSLSYNMYNRQMKNDFIILILFSMKHSLKSSYVNVSQVNFPADMLQIRT